MLDSSSVSAPALRLVLRYASPKLGPVLEVRSLRHPDLLLRHTIYRGVVVDETLLTRSFRFVSGPSRTMVAVLLDGALTIREPGPPLVVHAGEAVLIGGTSMPSTRWDNTAYLDLEWPSTDAPSVPRRLRPPDPGRLRALVAALADERAEQRTTLGLALSLSEEIGVPVPVSLQRLNGGPSPRDLRLAMAIEQQLANLASQATTIHLGDSANISPRQLQRVVQDFNRRYGINARNWRDTRTRWRVQIAAVLLSRPELTVAEVAHEVGYSSPNALARAFAQVGFAAPATVRASLCGPEPS